MAVGFVRSAEGQIVQGTMRRERPIKTSGETVFNDMLDYWVTRRMRRMNQRHVFVIITRCYAGKYINLTKL